MPGRNILICKEKVATEAMDVVSDMNGAEQARATQNCSGRSQTLTGEGSAVRKKRN